MRKYVEMLCVPWLPDKWGQCALSLREIVRHMVVSRRKCVNQTSKKGQLGYSYLTPKMIQLQVVVSFTHSLTFIRK